jgi:hypothetical protein
MHPDRACIESTSTQALLNIALVHGTHVATFSGGVHNMPQRTRCQLSVIIDEVVGLSLRFQLSLHFPVQACVVVATGVPDARLYSSSRGGDDFVVHILFYEVVSSLKVYCDLKLLL